MARKADALERSVLNLPRIDVAGCDFAPIGRHQRSRPPSLVVQSCLLSSRWLPVMFRRGVPAESIPWLRSESNSTEGTMSAWPVDFSSTIHLVLLAVCFVQLA